MSVRSNVIIAGVGLCIILAMLIATDILDSLIPACQKYASGTDAFFALPSDATDVTICRHQSSILCEFATSEAEFVKWVRAEIRSSRVTGEIEEIVLPQTIMNAKSFDSSRDQPFRRAEIKNGVYFAWSVGDQGVYTVYDRSNSRGYYHSHSR